MTKVLSFPLAMLKEKREAAISAGRCTSTGEFWYISRTRMNWLSM